MKSERSVLLELLEGPYDGVLEPIPIESVSPCPRCDEVHDVRMTMPPTVARLGPYEVPTACVPRRAPVPGDRVADYRFMCEGYRTVVFQFRGYSIVQREEYEERQR